VELGIQLDSLSLSKETSKAVEYPGEPAPVNTIYRPLISSTIVRIPVLVKGIVPAGPVRFSLGLGPEFALGLDTTADLEVSTPGKKLTGEAAKQLQDQTAKLRSRFEGMAVNQVFLTLALGLAIEAGPVSIPIELRAAYNPAGSENLVEYWSVGGTHLGNHPLDVRAFLGVCYDVDLL
jgi:hypothetical protein